MNLYLHPDGLMDAPYAEQELDVALYRAPTGAPAWQQRGAAHGVARWPDGRRLRIDACTPTLLRLRFGGMSTDFGPSLTERLGLVTVPVGQPGFECGEDADAITASTAALQFSMTKQTGDFAVRDSTGAALVESLDGGLRFSSAAGEYSGEPYFSFFRLGDQRVFGFGGRVMPPDRTGTSADIFAMKVGGHKGDYGGFPMPFFLSTAGYGLFVNNPWPHLYFDMGRTIPDRWFLHSPGGAADIFVIHGPEFPDIVRQFSELTGRIPTPSRWWLGYWCSSIAFKHADQMIADAERMRREGYPLDAVVMDGAWRAGPDFIKNYAQSHQYDSNDVDWHKDFGNGPDMVKRLQAMGVKTVLHLNSRLFKPDTAAKGLQGGVLRQQGDEVVVRVTDRRAEAYFETLLEPRVREGIGMWWLDHGDRVSGEIAPGVPSRMLFGTLWARAVQRSFGKSAGMTPLALSRGGGIGAQRYALPWPGDTHFGIERFAEDLWFAMNAGLCGFPVVSADLGGFTVINNPVPGEEEADEQCFSEENVCRRMIQSMFVLPNMRMHDGGNTVPKYPWNCRPSQRSLYREMLALRYRLTPYYYSYALRAARSGEPIVRPLVYRYRRDPRVWTIDDQAMIGDWLMVAPVVTRGVRARHVYLPEGDWYNYWTDERLRGPLAIEAPAPLHELSGLPLFVAAGALIASQPEIHYLPDDIPASLILDVYPGGDSCFELNESAAIINRFECSQRASGACEVRYENTGDFARSYTIRLHGRQEPPRVSINGASDDRRYSHWDAARRIASVRIDVAPDQSGVIEFA